MFRVSDRHYIVRWSAAAAAANSEICARHAIACVNNSSGGAVSSSSSANDDLRRLVALKSALLSSHIPPHANMQRRRREILKIHLPSVLPFMVADWKCGTPLCLSSVCDVHGVPFDKCRRQQISIHQNAYQQPVDVVKWISGSSR